MVNRWQKPGDNAVHQRYTTQFTYYNSFNNASVSDASYCDGSYIKLKNIAVSYDFPQEWCKKTHIQNFRLYVQGQNLFAWTSFVGFDPETGNYRSLPPLRVITFGIQAGL